MTTKDMNWYARPSSDVIDQILFSFSPRFIELCLFLLVGELPKGILCILTNITTSKQRCLFQDIVKHGHSTCTRGHTGECSNLVISGNSVY